MSSPAYIMITVAAVAPDYLSEALGKVGTLCGQLKDQAGALMTRYGVMSTGEHAGSLFLSQGYSELNGIDAAFNVYGSSAEYQALIGSGKVSVILRNIMRMEDIGLKSPSTNVPAYLVLTRWGSASPMLDRMRPLVHHFEDNGALTLRYATIATGSAAGRRLLGVAYPSMDAIEKTYDSLRGDPAFGAFQSDMHLDFRNIVRIVG